MITRSEFLFCSCENPLAFGEIDRFFRLTSVDNRRKDNIVAEHILLAERVAVFIPGIVKEHGTHNGIALFGSDFHMLFNIGAKALAKKDQIPENFIIALAEAPDFIRVARGLLDVAFLFSVAVTVAVKTHNGRKNAVLKPAHYKLSELLPHIFSY